MGHERVRRGIRDQDTTVPAPETRITSRPRTRVPAAGSVLPSAPFSPATRIRPTIARQRPADADPGAAPGRFGAHAKLQVGAVDDPLEHEADQGAMRIVAALHATGPTGGELADETAPRAPFVSRIQRRTLVGAGGGDVDASTQRELESMRGTGTPLDRRARSGMERAFGADLGAVRLHTGSRSADLNERFQASAF